MKLIWVFDVKDDLFQLGAQYGFIRVFVGIQGENEREVVALSEHEGMKGFHGSNDP